eukprot:scaffold35605_cov41-Cyclotella_meneghiniana.AAC.12
MTGEVLSPAVNVTWVIVRLGDCRSQLDPVLVLRCKMRWSVVCFQPAADFLNTFHKQCGAGCVLAAGNMPGIFIGNSTTGTDILDCWFPSGEVSIAAIEIRDVSCYPILEGLGEFIHDFWNNLPVNQIKATVPWYNFAGGATRKSLTLTTNRSTRNILIPL